MTGQDGFEKWARAEGLISESHGVRFVNSACDVARKAWNAAQAVTITDEQIEKIALEWNWAICHGQGTQAALKAIRAFLNGGGD